MANRIKGITIEIAGDTTKLNDALKSVNSEIRSTQSQLKDVEKLLKLDPGNTELLTQKQSLLNNAIHETRDKLSVLEQAAESANEALSKGTISKEQYDALQREIIETANALEKLESQAEESVVSLQKISKSGSDFKALGNQIESAGSALLPLSTTITGIGAAGIKVASDFEKGMSSVQAITGAAEKEFESLRNVAIDLGATTAFSASEVSDAMTEMAKAGWSTAQIIDGMAGVLDATAASGESLAQVSTIVADSITGFGLEAKDSALVADLLTQAANSGTIGISDLGETYKYVAPLAQSLGLSIQDVTTAISAMSMAGIKGSQAGTSLRTVLANLAKPSGTVKKAMDELGLSVSNADGTFKTLDEIVKSLRISFDGLTDEQKAYYATSLAGKEGMSGLLSLLNLTQEEYDALSQSMNQCSGIAGETAEIMQDNLQSKVEQLGGALESLAIRLSDYVLPFLTQLVEGLTALIDAFTRMNPFIQKTVLVFAGLIAILSPVLIITGKLINAFGTFLTLMPKLAPAITAVKTAFTALFTLMRANPVMIIITAVTALILAIRRLWSSSESFRTFWKSLWNDLTQIVVGAFTAIDAFISNAGSEILNSAAETWGLIKDTIAISVLDLKSFLTETWRAIELTITSVLHTLQSIFTSVWNAIRSFLTSSNNAIRSSFISTWSGIRSTVSAASNAIKSSVTSAFNLLVGSVRSAMNTMYSTIQSGFSRAVSYIKSLASSAYGWGRDMVMGIVNGIRSCISSVASAAKSVASTIRSYLHFSVPDVGPLTEYESWMPDFMKGLAKGIEDSRFLVERAVSNVATDMVFTPSPVSGSNHSNYASATDHTALLSGIKELADKLTANSASTISIPIYLGNHLLDEVIVDAQSRANLRSGGR